MTSEPGQGTSYFSRLDAEECWALLTEADVGRIAWVGEFGIVMIPVNYRVHEGAVVFQTAEGSILAKLAKTTPVAFEIDDIDGETATGWSVLVRGHSGPVSMGRDEAVSWLDDERSIWVAITPEQVSGRIVSGTKRGGNR